MDFSSETSSLTRQTDRQTEHHTPPSLEVPLRQIEAAFLPIHLDPDSLTQRTVIVTDVLRATTTIIAAIVNGCQKVIPQPSIDKALACQAKTPNSLLGGERGGAKIPGFDLGNSPLEYESSRVQGKTLILTTTNGTVAMHRCRLAKRILIGAMTNLTAVSRCLSPDQPVTIVCSGTDGEETAEDTIFAGALIEKMLWNRQTPQTNHAETNHPFGIPESAEADAMQFSWRYRDLLTDRAMLALHHWQLVKQQVRFYDTQLTLADIFCRARGGINLVKVGLKKDIEFASNIDLEEVVPELDPQRWEIRK